MRKNHYTYEKNKKKKKNFITCINGQCCSPNSFPLSLIICPASSSYFFWSRDFILHDRKQFIFLGGRRVSNILKYGTGLPSGFLWLVFFLFNSVPNIVYIFAIIIVLLKLSSFYHVSVELVFIKHLPGRFLPKSVYISATFAPHLRLATFQSLSTVLKL